MNRPHDRRVVWLWDIQAGTSDRLFNPRGARGEDLERSNLLANTVWEGELLQWLFPLKAREGYAAVEEEVKAEAL